MLVFCVHFNQFGVCAPKEKVCYVFDIICQSSRKCTIIYEWSGQDFNYLRISKNCVNRLYRYGAQHV